MAPEIRGSGETHTLNNDDIFAVLSTVSGYAGITRDKWDAVGTENPTIRGANNAVACIYIPHPGDNNNRTGYRYNAGGNIDFLRMLLQSNNVKSLLKDAEEGDANHCLDRHTKGYGRIVIVYQNMLDHRYNVFEVTPDGKEFTVPSKGTKSVSERIRARAHTVGTDQK